ncbi:hypothetical protein PVAG01_03359 [Phlyctema vagabunda]|uniref:DUF3604 domain-containing protein n=1 Tax=Phlyctema vagabunda TaxID=108571 RepID=A0ABR4PL77_9HELO
MKTLTNSELSSLAGHYFAPEGLYQYIKSLPFLGTVTSNTSILTAGEWTEITLTYEVGGSGLADGAWIKGTFKFYSDWALFQTTDRTRDNYLSAEYVANPLVHAGQTPATVQALAVRFDQKGHERPFQKAIIIDVVNGFLNPGDKIVVRLGDRRYGARGTRVQTFVERDFRMRWYVDPVGTSRFAAVKPDLVFQICPGPVASVKSLSSRVVRKDAEFPVFVSLLDRWGNTTLDRNGLVARLRITSEAQDGLVLDRTESMPGEGWSYTHFQRLSIPRPSDYIISVSISDTQSGSVLQTTTTYLTVLEKSLVPRPLFADLHVHSDDTVGTNSTSYNFSYARLIAGLDIVGYTANDFNITAPKWASTVSTINKLNKTYEGSFLLFPGTEWCGNSAAGGDHNVIFLDDPEVTTLEFPLDRHGNVARSFEWNEDGPAELTPGTWPLDEVYATYAHSPEKHLMIPHVGGRRCNLAWHHPQLERLLEIGSAWGLFEWLLRDAVQRGWKMGVCANSDEHRGRCGGGVPGTAVFGTKGGLTGVLAGSLDRREVARALRARRTFATTGERLVGFLSTGTGAVQGDDVVLNRGESANVRYEVYGDAGFSSVEIWDENGILYQRDLWAEKGGDRTRWRTLRISWGGAILYDRYREAVWDGRIQISGSSKIQTVNPFGGVLDVPEERIELISEQQIAFQSHTSGDLDGIQVLLDARPERISIAGTLGGYVKVGDVLAGNPHKAQPEFALDASWSECLEPGGKVISIRGGAELFVRVEVIPDVELLPRRIAGAVSVEGSKAVYLVGREWRGGKVITSPLFFEYK